VCDKTLCSEDFCQKQPLLLEHLQAVLQHNHKKNLTSITDVPAGRVFHIEDSLAVLPEVTGAPSGQMADLGSGAGFPGIPLALVSGRHTTLLESNKKKAQFLQGFVEDNDLLSIIKVSAARSEELALEQPEAFAVITARAVASLPALLELAAPLLQVGGHFISLKGKPEDAELERAAVAASKLSMRLVSSRAYTLLFEGNENHRLVLAYEKTGQPSITLPRRPGMATKRPLA